MLAGYRWRLGGEVLARLLLRGLTVGVACVAVASGLTWIASAAVQPVVIWLALLLPPLAALVLALLAWPSEQRTARIADRRLRLDERLATAIELSAGGRARGRFDALQVTDAVEQLRSAPSGWESGLPRRELALLGAFAVAAGLSLLLPLVPRPSLPANTEAQTPVDAAAAADDRVAVPDVLDMRSLGAAAAEEPTTDPDLAPRVRAAQAEQDSLDQLAQALSDVSATRGAADSIQRSDFSSAREQLNSVAEEADQLSDAAKKQLARALANAASAGGTDRQLADRERQAAQALGRGNYADQRQALRQLADQVQRSGARSVSPSQLARDVGRLQQQAGTSGAQPAGSAASARNGVQSQQGIGMNGAPGGQSQGGSDPGEQGGPGAGNGSVDGVGDPSGRLSTSGQLVEVPQKLSAGPGERPPTGNEDQSGANPGLGGRSVIESASTQHTGQLTPEQNLVPSEQRPIVRGYFR